MWGRGGAAVRSVEVLGLGEVVGAGVARVGEVEVRAVLGKALPVTKPYFSADADSPVYAIADARLRNAPATPAPLVARVRL